MSTLAVATVKSTGTGPVAFQNTSGTEIGTLCRAWVNFNGTGTVAIRQSFNVSSITDNGTGDYTVNFAAAMVDANYALSTMSPVLSDQGSAYQFGLRFPSNGQGGAPTLKTTTQVRLMARRDFDFDLSECYVAIFR